MRAPVGREADLEKGMVFAGSLANIAERIVHLHKLLGHSRQILPMDVGGMPHKTFLKSIELLVTKVYRLDYDRLSKIISRYKTSKRYLQVDHP